MFVWRSLLACAFVVSVDCASDECRDVEQQNGRFPTTKSVVVNPADPSNILIGATFGALISEDGVNFSWVCERAIGYTGTFDPKYRISSAGTIFATTSDGLRISRDGGCTYELAPSPLDVHWGDALELDASGHLWIGTSSTDRANDVFLSTDDGTSFVSRNLQDDTAWWKSIKVGPSDENVVYVSGYRVAMQQDDGGVSGPEVLLRRTSNGGDSWDVLSTDDFVFSSSPQLEFMAIAPTNPNIVYARVEGAVPPLGDALYRTTDGGSSWQNVLESTDAIQGVAMMSDVELIVGTINDKVYRSTNGGGSFSAISGAPHMDCLHRTPQGRLLACGTNWDPDNMAVGTSEDDGESWAKLFRFSEIRGPKACQTSTEQFDCAINDWIPLAQQLGIIGQPDAAADAATVCTSDSGCSTNPFTLWMLLVIFCIGRFCYVP